MKRRDLLLGTGMLLSTYSVDVIMNSEQVQATFALPTEDEFQVSGEEGLGDRAARKGLKYGTFPHYFYDQFAQTPALQDVTIRECNLLVAGFYWKETHPERDRFDFTAPDNFAQFAADHGLSFRGHPLIWDQIHPEWLIQYLNDPATPYEEIRTLLINHIQTVVSRYAGRVHSWDVVNEGIEPSNGREDGLKTSPWFNRLGSEYIELAFRTAAAADPNALLVFNETGIEYDHPVQDTRREAVLRLLRDLKEKDVPIHALGIQAHLNLPLEYLERDGYLLNGDKLRQFIRDVADLGLKVFITELDVSDRSFTSEVGYRDYLVAKLYQEFLDIVLQEPAVTVVVTWGIDDANSWLNDYAPRPDGLPGRPLLLDRDFNRKLAWRAIAQSIDHCPAR